MNESKHIVRNIVGRREEARDFQHPLNAAAKRRTLSLGDATGLTGIGVHLNFIAPGDETTELHSHECLDEFIYILSGTGTLYLDDAEYELEPGDFVGFPARGPAHAMKNNGTVELVYLVGGGRPDFDVCNYPRIGKRLYVIKRPEGRTGEFVDLKHIELK